MYKKSAKKNTPKLYALDFETFTKDGNYYKLNQKTNIYAIYVEPINLRYNWQELRYLPSETTNRKLDFGEIDLGKVIQKMTNDKNYGTWQLWYFHNGINFDFEFIVRWLKNSNYKYYFDKPEKEINENCWVYKNGGNKYKSLIIYLFNKFGKRIKIEMRDSAKIWARVSIKRMSEIMKIDNLEKPNLDFELQKDIPKSWYYLENDVKVRVRQDAKILAKWIELYLPKLLPKGSTIKSSASSIAMSRYLEFIKENFYDKRDKDIFKKLIGIQKNEIIEGINNLFIENKWYTGGLTSFKERNKEINEKIYVYDVNSLYPYIMSAFKHPYGTIKIKKSLKNIDLEKNVVFVKATMTNLKQKNTNYVRLIRHQTNKHEAFELYAYEMDSYEYYERLEHFEIWKKHIDFEIESLEYYVFKAKDYFSKFIEILNDIKINSTNEVERAIAKLIMNALYGKFGENAWREEFFDNELIKAEEVLKNEKYHLKSTFFNELLEKMTDENSYIMENYSPSKSAYVPVAASITSLARMYLMQIMLECEKVFYVDTDSIFSNTKLSASLVDDKILGKWKLEAEGNKFKVFRAKNYCLAKDNEIQKAGISGIDYKEILKKYSQFTENLLYIRKQKKKIDGGYVIIDQVQKLVGDKEWSKLTPEEKIAKYNESTI